MPDSVTVYGAPYSVYVRIVRLALAEKGVPYDLVEVDIFAEGGPSADHLERHPFGRIPAFEHDGFRLFETSPITRYIDDAFDGPAVMPLDARAAARANQIISMMDNYAYRSMVWDVYVERVRMPLEGGTADQAKIANGLQIAEVCLATLQSFMGEAEFLTGPEVTLADIHALPMFDYFNEAPEGADMLAQHLPLKNWLQRMMGRPTARAIR
jgi:glutathione S-transferase